jgi:hypothetical protein
MRRSRRASDLKNLTPYWPQASSGSAARADQQAALPPTLVDRRQREAITALASARTGPEFDPGANNRAARLRNRAPRRMLCALRSSKGIVMSIDTQAATDRLMRFLSVEGVTGEEAAIGREIAAALKQAGVPAKAIRGSTTPIAAFPCRPRPATSSSTCPAAARCTTSRGSCS